MAPTSIQYDNTEELKTPKELWDEWHAHEMRIKEIQRAHDLQKLRNRPPQVVDQNQEERTDSAAPVTLPGPGQQKKQPQKGNTLNEEERARYDVSDIYLEGEESENVCLR
ncbi:hypothetical protein AWENTII_003339 [Aspergillus wentii]|nr:hypothetical protein MW887_011991 [Aspergillus wentii]